MLDKHIHHIAYHDGATLQYNASTGALNVRGIKTAEIHASVSVILDTPVVRCTQHLEANSLDVKQSGTFTGNYSHSGGTFSSNSVVMHTHVHRGVQAGSSNTGEPT